MGSATAPAAPQLLQHESQQLLLRRLANQALMRAHRPGCWQHGSQVAPHEPQDEPQELHAGLQDCVAHGAAQVLQLSQQLLRWNKARSLSKQLGLPQESQQVCWQTGWQQTGLQQTGLQQTGLQVWQQLV
jgi:hypothetical protein